MPILIAYQPNEDEKMQTPFEIEKEENTKLRARLEALEKVAEQFANLSNKFVEKVESVPQRAHSKVTYAEMKTAIAAYEAWKSL